MINSPSHPAPELKTILLSLESRLAAATLINGDTAFGTTRIYDLTDLAQAMQDLYIESETIALIILQSVHHETEITGNRLIVIRTLEASVLISSKSYANRRDAMLGSESNVGLLDLADASLRALAGQSDDGYYVTPHSGEMFAVGGQHSENPERLAFRQPFFIAPQGYFIEKLTRGTVRRGV